MRGRFGGFCVVVAVALTALAPGARADLNPFTNYANNISRAAAAGNVAKVRSLLSDGNSPNQVDEDNQRAGLHEAAMNGNIQIVAILIKAGAQIDIRDKLGNTPLIYASERDHAEVLKLLLDVGAQVDWQNHDGMTALMIAAKNGEVEMVRVLLEHGANPTKSDFTGRDAIGWAQDSHRPAVIVLLKNAAAHRH
jgi:ankyrin repeat protein